MRTEYRPANWRYRVLDEWWNYCFWIYKRYMFNEVHTQESIGIQFGKTKVEKKSTADRMIAREWEVTKAANCSIHLEDETVRQAPDSESCVLACGMCMRQGRPMGSTTIMPTESGTGREDSDCWNFLLHEERPQKRGRSTNLAMYTAAWSIWKEQNRRCWMHKCAD